MGRSEITNWRKEIDRNKHIIRSSNIIASRATTYLGTVTESWEIIKRQWIVLLGWIMIYVISCLVLAFSFTEEIDLRIVSIIVAMNALTAAVVIFLPYKLHVSLLDDTPPKYIEITDVSTYYDDIGFLHLKLMKRLRSLLNYIFSLSFVTLLFLVIIDVKDYLPGEEMIDRVLPSMAIAVALACTMYFMVLVVRLIKIYRELLEYKRKQIMLIETYKSKHS